MNTADESPSFLEEARELATQAAQEAGELILGYFERPELQDVSFKGKRDPVTEADRRAEELIFRKIRSAFPDHRFLGEEGGEQMGGDFDPSSTQWYVDPLDGTVNFAHGLPVFAVSIGMAHKGRLCLGVVFAPKLDELYVGVTGQGATLNGRALQVSGTKAVEDAVVSTGFAYQRDQLPDNNVDEFNRLILKVRGLRRCGSAAWDLASVAAGRFDAHWERHLNPWDMAAGIVLVREAGGKVSDLRGGDSILESGTILATNRELHPAMQAELQG